MFEPPKVRPPTPATTALVDRIAAASRAEAQAAAERLVAIADLFEEREKKFGGCDNWVIDIWEAVAAEVAATLRVSLGIGKSYLRYATAMRYRLPKVGAVFEAGDIDYRLFQTIVFRTFLITDLDALDKVDGQIAARAPRWPSMTRRKLAAKIDTIVARVDPDAVRRSKELAEDRFVKVEDSDAGMAEVVGRMFDTTSKALDRRLNELAATVCEADPRTRDQRRADAIEALVAGTDRMPCRCDSADCPAATKTRPPGTVVIHVVAEQGSLDGTSQTPAVVAGSDALISAEVLRELAATARLLPVIGPVDADPEPRYIPSRGLADFVRCRDLTCRAPGCDQPAMDCDVDHTVPYECGGATHASNLKLLCRKHHLLKTFWGWRDEQLPDGTVIWTLPDGRKHVTTPGSALLFPSLCAPTGSLPEPPEVADAPCNNRLTMMPLRSRTRAQHRAAAIEAERRRNERRRTQRRRWDKWDFDLHSVPDGEPPPF
ncbi:HNH endonuclease signature motif containing protein [[Mycobacterium] burgundiense]|uniref:HNH endonuclease signature motif containing protein n=1 Tax=[Mycobacterium] burgundiense TaxID=3064286 RepID=A0ABM9M3D9_9MYCO|nr:HNH endonuclease signature motif containing protein [Mycolicibacterium sp. MU0053]CAJ1509611.1 HNH endonuclease signature motif containing protein [Mycolicibacterium sp. MU0053]